MNAPVATYSSGMTVRLGFSIAIHANTDILLADEVLAVGDLSFALKCYKKISEFREGGGSLILVSHGMQLVRNTCEKVLWIDKGIIRNYGDTQKVCDEYEDFMVKKDFKVGEQSLGNRVNNDSKAQIEAVEFINSKGEVSTSFVTGDVFRARIHYNLQRPVKNPLFTYTIMNAENINILSSYTNFDGAQLPEELIGRGYVDMVINNLAIKPSIYTFTATLSENSVNNLLDWHDKAYTFTVENNGHTAYGLVRAEAKWELSAEDDLTFDKFLKLDNPIKPYIDKYLDVRNMIIFDIGACEGEDSVRYTNLYPGSHIYSFEPLPSNYQKIIKNIDHYKKTDRIRAFQIALSDKVGEADFFVSSGAPRHKVSNDKWDYGNKSSSLLAPQQVQKYTDWLKFQQKIVVPTSTIDKFCKEKHIKKIDLMHIDVQGAELMVLKGAASMLTYTEMILVEVETVELYKDQALADDIDNYLKSKGFVLLADYLNSFTGDRLYIKKSTNERQ
jgi:FkbM family methyltransferase